MRPFIVHAFSLSTINNTQQFTIFFIIVNAVHVSGGFSAYHQELKNCAHSIWYVPGLFAATAIEKNDFDCLIYIQM
jgi:hypothetical protein